MDYNQALDYIHSVSWLGSKPGLSRTRTLLSLMDNPQDKLKFIHVAGTNGKGSTCAMLASVLGSAGYKTGLYTSPYILEFNERMKINGKNISNRELAEITAYVKTFADTMEDSPTEFELVTAIGFEYFYRNNCDIVVLEVGLGGELDSTNIINAPLLAIITELALDHTVVLGNSLTEIAKAKAGIIKAGATVLSADNTQEGAAVVAAVCHSFGCNHHTPNYDEIENQRCSVKGISFSYRGEEYSVPLCGSYQFRNVAMVLKAAELLGINTATVKAGLATIQWRARFEILSENPCFIYDGGHNPQGVSAAIDSYKQIFGELEPVILIGLMADKDYKKELTMLTALSNSFVAVTPNNPRSMSANDLSQEIALAGGKAIAAESIEQGVKLAIEMANGTRPVFALGSLYMYADILVAVNKLLSR